MEKNYLEIFRKFLNEGKVIDFPSNKPAIKIDQKTAEDELYKFFNDKGDSNVIDYTPGQFTSEKEVNKNKKITNMVDEIKRGEEVYDIKGKSFYEILRGKGVILQVKEGKFKPVSNIMYRLELYDVNNRKYLNVSSKDTSKGVIDHTFSLSYDEFEELQDAFESYSKM